MDKEITKDFKFLHGKKTYFMAWVVEICLFVLAMSLAVFNLYFGINSGDLVTGLLLAVGWVILAVIELATIPMAGSLKMAKGVNKLVAFLGLLGLLFLAGYTVYEFNEIASEYMTRGAREAAMKVENLKQNIAKEQKEIETMDSLAEEATKELNNLKDQKESELLVEDKSNEEKKKNTEEYYQNLITEAARTSEFPIYNAQEKAQLERYNQQITNHVNEISSINEQKDERQKALSEESQSNSEPRIKQIESSIEDLDQQRAKINEDGEKRISEASGGLFTSKEKKIAGIQKAINDEIAKIDEEKESLRKQIATLQTISFDTLEFQAMDKIIKKLQDQIDGLKVDKSEIEQVATKRMDTPQFQDLLEDRKDEVDRLYNDRKSSIAKDSEEHTEKIKAIEIKFSEKITELEEASKTQSDRIGLKEDLNERITEKATQISTLIQEASLKHEKTMYYRMASWFSEEDKTGFGKLPRKEDYNKVLKYIFAPIGLFFGIAAITLAYLGTGFMYESEREHKGETKEKELKQNISELKEEIKKQPKLEKQIKLLEKNAEKNELELIKQKQRIFDVVKSVPQTITINSDEEQKDDQI